MGITLFMFLSATFLNLISGYGNSVPHGLVGITVIYLSCLCN
jgi:hypothetical protein